MFNNPNITPELLLAMAGGVSQGPNITAGLGNMFGNASNVLTAQKATQAEKLAENQTRAWLQSNFPGEDFTNLSGDALKSAYSAGLKRYTEAKTPTKPKYLFEGGKIIKLDEATGQTDVVADYSGPKKPNLIGTRNGIYDADSRQWITPPEGVQTDGVEHGLTPIWGKDANGNLVIGTLDKSGKFHQTELPEGFQPQPGTSTVDLGTTVGVRNNKTGEIIEQVPKDLAGAEEQKVLGKNKGENIASAPADLQAGLNAKDLITQLKTDPNREWGTGTTGWLFNGIPSSPGYDYQTKVNQAKSGAFLTAIQQMRGLGALSNAEGDTATKAVTRMNTATSEEAFMEALNDYEKIIDQGIAVARSRIAGNPTQVDQPRQPVTSGKTTTGIPFSVEPD